MKKPTAMQRAILEALDDDSKLVLYPGLGANRTRFSLNSWPVNKRSVDTCIEHGWIEVQAALYAHLPCDCTITIEGQEAIGHGE